MSEKLCALEKIGGSMSETVLWTNPSPTSSMGNGVVANLSDSISNFDYIKVTYRKSTSDNTEISEIMSVTDFIMSNVRLPLGSAPSSGGVRIRTVRYTSSTTATFGDCVILGSIDRENTSTIPLKIIGVKH